MPPILRTLFLGAALFVQCTMLHAQSSASLELSLHVPTGTVALDGTLKLLVLLRNVADHQTVAFRGDPSFKEQGGLVVTVVDAVGAPRDIVLSDDPDLVDPAAPLRVQLLGPGHGVSVQRRIPARSLFPEPGQYQLLVTYEAASTSPATLPAGVIEARTAASAMLDIEVTP